MTARSLLLIVLIAACTLPSWTMQQEPASPTTSSGDISGTYTFLRDGEYVQFTLEDGRLSGYVSRFGEGDSDKGDFIDQFFDKATLSGDHLTFNTKTVHGIWYDFNGTIATTAGKKPDEEGYRIIKGTLVQHTTDAKGTERVTQRQVEFKSFPSDLGKP